MKLKAKQREMLAALRVETFEYHLGYDRQPTESVSMIWGDRLEGPRGTIFIEHQADEYGGNWRWYVRRSAGDVGYLASFKTLRQALPFALRRIA